MSHVNYFDHVTNDPIENFKLVARHELRADIADTGYLRRLRMSADELNRRVNCRKDGDSTLRAALA